MNDEEPRPGLDYETPEEGAGGVQPEEGTDPDVNVEEVEASE